VNNTNPQKYDRDGSFSVNSRPLAGRSRRGLSYAEVLVSATVLTTIMTIVTVSSFRIARVWKDVRQQQSALNELTNQLDRLTMLPSDEVAALVGSMEASDECKELLCQPKFTGQVEEQAPFGQRLTVSITWQKLSGDRSKPLQLSAWWPTTNQSKDGQQ